MTQSSLKIAIASPVITQLLERYACKTEKVPQHYTSPTSSSPLFFFCRQHSRLTDHPSKLLQQDSKAANDTTNKGKRPESLTSTQRPNPHHRRSTRRRATSITITPRATRLLAPKPGVNRLPTRIRRSSRPIPTAHPTTRGTHRPRQRRRVLPRRVRRTARVIGATRARAVAVAVAVGHALRAPFLADVVGQGLGVFGDVGGAAVGADAGVGEGGPVAVVGFGGCAVGRGLEAD